LLAADAKAATGLGGPVVDGRSIPRQTWIPGVPPEAAGVLLLIGNCKDETTLFSLGDAGLFSLDWPTLRERELQTRISKDEIDHIIGKYREDYPKDSASDLYFRIGADRGFRTNAIAQAESKLVQA